jgi:diguanylate cyclase (GGDEF)-like protein/PAS domain S-box-containing protein
MDSFRPLPGITTVPRPRRLSRIVWLFVGIVICLLTVAFYSVEIISAGRDFVGAEGHWSRAQKDAVFYLTRYALDAQPGDWAAYERAIAVPLGDRQARLELEKPEPDMQVVRTGFLQGRNASADVESMASLYRRFRNLGPVERAVGLWETGDRYIDELVAVASQLRSGSAIPTDERARLTQQISLVNENLARVEDRMVETLAEGQRAAQHALLAGMAMLATALLFMGAGVSRRFMVQNERLQQTLRENEAQLRHLIESAPLPLLIVRPQDQQILYANERALQQFSLNMDSLGQHTLAEFHVDPEIRGQLAESLSRQGFVRDYEVHMRGVGGKEFWLLLSGQPIRFRGEVCLLAALANIDERKRMQEDMRRKAMHDALTGLPNRAMFMESLDRAIRKAQRRRSRFSILFVDLDHFKQVNDTLGHNAGDKLLLAVSDRLVKSVRQSDLVARLAGDEFVVLLEETKGPEEVMIVAQKVIASFARPVLLEWREVSISGSIGVASFPEDGAEMQTLLKHADAAMYQAKERGRNNFQFYSDELNRISHQRAQLETRVRGALDNQEFFLQYQPEIELATGRLAAVEALLRWREAASGVVMPPDFLPAAEENGTIIAIGHWVLERALNDMKAWMDQGLDVILSVNLSARQLQHPELVAEVARALKDAGMAPRSLRVEVPETALMHANQSVDQAIRGLHGLGVAVAIDNFGTGYSSLGLVRGLPIQAVKIDRSLVSNCPNKKECAAIVQAVGGLGRSLGLTVIASGVETEEEKRLMESLGCVQAQGNFIGAPSDWTRIAQLARASPVTAE